MTSPSPESPGPRNRALIALGITLAIAAATWIGLSRAADVGVARIARIDRVRVACDSGWAAATTMRDTLSVDRRPLADTIDAGTSSALATCADLRPSTMSSPRAQPNPREMRPEIGRPPSP